MTDPAGLLAFFTGGTIATGEVVDTGYNKAVVKGDDGETYVCATRPSLYGVALRPGERVRVLFAAYLGDWLAVRETGHD